MDLSISPDFDVRICYAVVIVSGVIVAVVRVNSLLHKARAAWLLPETWFLLLAYAAIPPLLFWLLDRTGAINDTSLFAALIVGLAYQQLVAGGYEGISAPATLSAFWSPFLSWAESLASRIRDTIQVHDKKFRDRLVRKAALNDVSLQKFVGIAKGISANLPNLDIQLGAIDAQLAALGTDNVRFKKAAIAVDEISLAPDYAKILRRASLISPTEELWRLVGWSGIHTFAGIICFVILAVLAALWVYNRPALGVHYSIWRLAKPNATKLDQFRARERLSEYLQDSDLSASTFQHITFQLKQPGHSIERQTVFVHLLLQHRDNRASARDLPLLLIDALRAETADVRTRVHHALLLIAGEATGAGQTLPQDLTDWTPADGDSIALLEKHIKDWQSFFAATSKHKSDTPISSSTSQAANVSHALGSQTAP